MENRTTYRPLTELLPAREMERSSQSHQSVAVDLGWALFHGLIQEHGDRDKANDTGKVRRWWNGGVGKRRKAKARDMVMTRRQGENK